MHAKVVRIGALAERGYRMSHLERRCDGSVRVRFRNGNASRTLAFAFYELPALEQSCEVVGQAS
jgi:hypothetical protein